MNHIHIGFLSDEKEIKDKLEIDNIAEFKLEVIELCKKYGISISHEDEHGSFLFKEYKDDLAAWFLRGIIYKRE